jgi:TatD DNase family protein
VVAIGEIGLDFYRNLSPPDVQREAFERQLALAAEHHLPVVVHDRDAHAAVTDALLTWTSRGRAEGARGMLHAFSGDAEMSRRLVDAGFLISFALPVTFRSAAGPRAAAAVLAPGSFLVETDAPYLGPDSAGRNEPMTVLRVAAALAQLRGTTLDEVASGVNAAYRRLRGG